MAFMNLWIVSFLFITFVSSQNSTQPRLPTFGDVLNVLGAMERTDQDFQDGLILDLFSPKNRTLTVQQNKSPLPAHFVSGENGEPFIALSSYSYIIRMNETANDLIAKIEIPYNPTSLNSLGIQEANTYVATLSEDKKSWNINEKQRNVHRSENNTRIIKMTSLDGEYLLVGRGTVDTSNTFVQYGQGETRTVNLTGGPGIQQAEFIDGLRFSVQSASALRVNADLKNGISAGSLPANSVSVNSFAWVVNTTNPQAALIGEIRFPINRMMLAALPASSSPTIILNVARLSNNSTSGMFMPLVNSETIANAQDDQIVVPGLTQLDGQYILMITETNAIGRK